MRYRTLLFLSVVFILIDTAGISQNERLEYSQAKYNNFANDSLKLDYLQKLSYGFNRTNADSAKKYTQIYIQLAKQTTNKLFLSRGYALLSDMYAKENNFKLQLDCEIKALRLREEAKDSIEMARSYGRIAYVYMNLADYTKTEFYLDKMFLLFKRHKNTKKDPNLARAYLVKGIFMNKQKKYQESVLALSSAETENNQNFTDSMVYLRLFSNINYQLGIAYENLKDYTKALSCYSNALKFYEKHHDQIAISECKNGIASVNLKQKNFTGSLNYNEQSEIAAIKSGKKEDLLDVYKNYIAIYDSLKDYKKVSKYSALKSELQDSLTRIAFNKALAEAKTKFETDEKIRENLLLEEKNKVQQLQLTQNNYLLVGSLILIISIIAFALLFFRQNKLKSEQKSMQLEQKLLRSQMNPHFLFNSLNAIHSVVLSGDVKIASKYLASFAKLIRSFLESSRNELITLEKEIGLLRNYIDLQILRFESNIKYNITIDEKLNTTEILLPPMLLQPFIENAFEHGLNKIADGFLDITFILQNSFLIITVADNGEGLGIKEKEDHTSLATTITNERLLLLNKGKTNKIQFAISEAYPEKENKGVKVVFQLPIALS